MAMREEWEQQQREARAKKSQLIWKLLKVFGLPFVGLIIIWIVIDHSVGINSAGDRTVIQYLNGGLSVRFEPGVYWKWFGHTQTYPDVITFDFDRSNASSGATIDQKGIGVRYGQDGGTGVVYGIARFLLPADESSMILIHKEFKSPQGVAYKTIKTVTEESMNLTASLMSSEDAYATKRAIFTDLARRQISSGPFVTEQRTVEVKDELTGKMTYGVISVVKNDPSTHLPMHNYSDLKKYNITLSGLQLGDPDFEPKTLEQIASKREATNAIITGKANAERAKQDAITAEEQGRAKVVAAKYEKEVEKERATVDAQREKEVAEIKAQQLVEVAKQAKLEAEQKKLTANEYKQEQILIGQGDAERKRLVMEADGALSQKLEAWTTVNNIYAKEFGKQKWVPEVLMGGHAEGAGSNQAGDLIGLLMTKTAKELALDLKVTPSAPAKK